MKRCFIIASLALITLTGWAADNKGKVLAQTEGSITFAVDEGLKPRDVGRKTRYNGEQMAHLILQGENIRKEAFHIMATSFADAQNLNHSDKDAFYKTIVDAYANHKSIVLSPDIMWLLISQGFARYVNGHAEALRSQLVDHEGQKDLIVQSELDSTGATNWPKLLIAVGMMACVMIAPNFFSKLGGALSMVLIGMVVCEIVLLILGVKQVWIDWIVAAIFTLYIGYDIHRSQQYPKTLDNAVDSALDIYMDIANLFIRILSIMGKRND